MYGGPKHGGECDEESTDYGEERISIRIVFVLREVGAHNVACAAVDDDARLRLACLGRRGLLFVLHLHCCGKMICWG